jgi:hypothetical protein
VWTKCYCRLLCRLRTSGPVWGANVPETGSCLALRAAYSGHTPFAGNILRQSQCWMSSEMVGCANVHSNSFSLAVADIGKRNEPLTSYKNALQRQRERMEQDLLCYRKSCLYQANRPAFSSSSWLSMAWPPMVIRPSHSLPLPSCDE